MTLNFKKRLWICGILSAVSIAPGFSQQVVPDSPAKYILGPGDEFAISSDAEEIDGKTVRIAPDGDIYLPVIGEIHAAGMTIPALQSKLVEHLKGLYRNPHAAVNMTQFRSQPVSVYGAVVTNNEFQLEGTKTLSQILSKAGGPRTDAGYRIIIKRTRDHGPIPLPSNKLDPSGNYFVAEVRLRDLVHATRPESDIEIMGGDTITVPPGEIVYVSGAVNKQGGFVLDDATIPIARLIALAEGTKKTAKLKSAVIYREEPGGKLQEIPINLADKEATRNASLRPRDILVIDDSAIRGAVGRTAGSVLQTLAGLAIYGIP